MLRDWALYGVRGELDARGERQQAIDGTNDFGDRQPERVQRRCPWGLGFKEARSAGLLRRVRASGSRTSGPVRGGQSAGTPIRIGSV